jgi:hypothetical protein
MTRTVILKTAGSNGALDAVRSKLEKAETSGMTTADLVEFFDAVFKTLKDHALRKHSERSDEEISGEQAFSRLYSRDDGFRSIVTKAQQLQSEIANSV